MNFFKNLDCFNSNVALLSHNKTITYKELLSNADLIGNKINNQSLIFVIGKNDVESITGYVGFMRANSVIAMLDKKISIEFLSNLINRFKPQYLYVEKSDFDKFLESALLLSISEIIYTFHSYVLVKTNFNEKYELNPELALLLTTSGSTGTQKFVRQSYKNIFSNAQSIVQYLEIKSDHRAITTLPLSYTFGLSVIHSHLFVGASIILTDRSILEREFWVICKSSKATNFAGVPYTYEMLKRLRFENMDLPNLEYIIQAGGKLNKDLCSFFADVCLRKGIKFFVMYGQTEATARISYLPWKLSKEKAGSIGISIPGGKIYIQDTNNNIISKPDIAGELIYEGDNVTLGYAESFKDLSKGDENNGILHTGDVAMFDSDGFFYIVGRVKRFLKIFGKRINLDEVESYLMKHSIDCACSGIDDNLVVYITNSNDEIKVKNILKKAINLNKIAFRIKIIDEIPRNTSNKILYSQLK